MVGEPFGVGEPAFGLPFGVGEPALGLPTAVGEPPEEGGVSVGEAAGVAPPVGEAPGVPALAVAFSAAAVAEPTAV
jgi:hypothetical protein